MCVVIGALSSSLSSSLSVIAVAIDAARSFDEYKQHTLQKTKKRVAESVKSLSSLNS